MLPGRINANVTMFERESIFHGFCSELCGVMHSYMPITGVTVDTDVIDVLHTNDLDTESLNCSIWTSSRQAIKPINTILDNA
jgi:heme/copper-type cytochrome/quinol oxidase subunit 2